MSSRLLIFHGLLNLLKFKHSTTFYGLLSFDKSRNGEEWRAVFNILHILVFVKGSVQEAICSKLCGVKQLV